MNGSDLVERLLSGNKRALARVISRIEGEDARVPDIISEIYPHTGEAVTVGFTGPPGVGKSSIIAALIKLYSGEDKKIGVCLFFLHWLRLSTTLSFPVLLL